MFDVNVVYMQIHLKPVQEFYICSLGMEGGV